MPGYRNPSKIIQALGSPATGCKWETSPENWGQANAAYTAEKAIREREVQVSPWRA